MHLEILGDDNEGDFQKVTTEAQLGLIGGTMGLLTGFSIISGVEIVYYISKGILSLMTERKSTSYRYKNYI